MGQIERLYDHMSCTWLGTVAAHETYLTKFYGMEMKSKENTEDTKEMASIHQDKYRQNLSIEM